MLKTLVMALGLYMNIYSPGDVVEVRILCHHQETLVKLAKIKDTPASKIAWEDVKELVEAEECAVNPNFVAALVKKVYENGHYEVWEVTSPVDPQAVHAYSIGRAAGSEL